jgi:hypothetical protein
MKVSTGGRAFLALVTVCLGSFMLPALATTAVNASSAAIVQGVAPLPALGPACYGDARSMGPVGGSLDPIAFGAFFNSSGVPCSGLPTASTGPGTGTWTFEVQTQDTWPQSSFGMWRVYLDTNSPGGSNCLGLGFDHMAQVAQLSAGNMVAQVGAVNASCNFVGTPTSASWTINGNTVAITFPWTAIGNAPTLVWQGLLQSFTEAQTQSGGDVVPCDGPPGCIQPTPDGQFITGAVAESLPSAPPGACALTSLSGTQVATLANPAQDLQAVTALVQAGLGNVHDYRDSIGNPSGVLSFSGSTAAGTAALSHAGISLAGTTSQPAIAPSQIYQPQAILTSGGIRSSSNLTQWNLDTVGTAAAHSVTTGNGANGVLVADIDTGLDYLHPNLNAANLLPGFDESTGRSMGPNTPEPGNTDTGQANSGAGTAVAGVIAAVPNTNIGSGFSSLGDNTRILPVKVNFDDTANASAEIDAGIRWAADNGARVINLSFGGVCPDPNLLSAIQHAQGQGALVVAAAGDGALNSLTDTAHGTNDVTSNPADDPGVVAVGATGRDGIRAAYSNTGSYVSMVAPGGSDISGDSPDDLPLLAPTDQCPGAPCYATGAGTGFAAAEVSAEAALIWSPQTVPPSARLTTAQVDQVLTSTTTGEGVSGTDIEYGAGLESAAWFNNLVLLPATSTIAAGTAQTFLAVGFNPLDNGMENVSPATSFTISPNAPGTGATCDNTAHTCTATRAGTYTVTGTYTVNTGSGTVTRTGTATVIVTPAALDHLALSPAISTVGSGAAQAYAVTGFDRFGNSLGDVSAATSFAIAPKGGSTGASCNNSTHSCAAIQASTYTVTATDAGKTGTATLTVNPVFTVRPASATAIAIGANGAVWILGATPLASNFGIYHWNGSTWVAVSGGAVRIAVDAGGNPWVVNAVHQIFHRSGSGWAPAPGLATDFGVGANGSLWIIGTNRVSGGFGIYHWNGRAWIAVPGGAVRIAVDPLGNPWVLNTAHQIFHWNGTGWTGVPGGATDIAVGPNGAIWIVGASPVGGGFGIYRWNGSTWIAVPGGAVHIAVAPSGNPWVINSAQQIFSS